MSWFQLSVIPKCIIYHFLLLDRWSGGRENHFNFAVFTFLRNLYLKVVIFFSVLCFGFGLKKKRFSFVSCLFIMQYLDCAFGLLRLEGSVLIQSV